MAQASDNKHILIYLERQASEYEVIVSLFFQLCPRWVGGGGGGGVGGFKKLLHYRTANYKPCISILHDGYNYKKPYKMYIDFMGRRIAFLYVRIDRVHTYQREFGPGTLY